MSQPPGQWQGYPEQDDPRTVPQVGSQQDDPRTVPQVGSQQPQYEQQWQPMQPAQSGQYWQPGYGYPRRRHPLAWVLVGIGLFMAVVVTLVLVLTSGPDTDTPEDVADAVAEAFNDNDLDELVALTCADYRERTKESIEGLTEYGPRFAATARVDDVAMAGDGRAVADIMLTYTKVPDELEDVIDVGDDEDLRVRLASEGGEWCVLSLG
jgi:hypothetical protein